MVVLVTVSIGSLTVAGALFNSYNTEFLKRSSSMGIDLLTAKKMASIAGYQETMLVGFAIACMGILTSLVRGPRHKNQ